MTYLSSTQLKQYEDEGFVSPIDIFSKEKAKEIRNEIELIEKKIPRCVAINLKPQTDDNSLNLLQALKKTYNHFNMGIYLTALEDGQINIGNPIDL